MIKLMLELIKLFGEKKIEKLNIYNDDIYIQTEYGGERYSIAVKRLAEAGQDVQV